MGVLEHMTIGHEGHKLLILINVSNDIVELFLVIRYHLVCLVLNWFNVARDETNIQELPNLPFSEIQF